MFFWVKTASLFLIRSRSASVVLTLMVLIAVSSLIFLSSFAVGINDAMVRNSVGLYSGNISGFNLPGDVTEKQLMKKGVGAVLKRTRTQGFLHVGGQLEMLTLITVDPGKEKEYTALWKKTVTGRYLEPVTNGIFLSRDMAERLGIAPGNPVEFNSGTDSPSVSLTVSGVYHTGLDQFDRGIAFCPTGALPASDGAWDAAVFLDRNGDMDRVIAEYRNAMPTMDFRTWTDLMPDLQQLIELNYISMGIVIVLIFVVISFGIACAFTIFILKNLRVYGIMKVMGVTPLETVALIFSKVILVNLAASALGILAGVTAVAVFAGTGIDLSAWTSHNQYFIVSGMIFPRLTAFSLCLPPASALLFSIPAAIWPAALGRGCWNVNTLFGRVTGDFHRSAP